MKRIALLVVALFVSVLAVTAAEDFSGKWSGTFSGVGPNGQPSTENIVLNLVHKGAELSGTAGPSAERQWKVLKGKVDGDKLAFEVQAGDDASSGGPLLKFTLAFAEGHLKGDVNLERGETKLSAKLDATRAK